MTLMTLMTWMSPSRRIDCKTKEGATHQTEEECTHTRIQEYKNTGTMMNNIRKEETMTTKK